ncbi:MAG: insulinase family protein [Alphaproteobacteria bacterium]|nr:insulinase family protein [Alphaproteobacteria bacterium]
MTAWTRRFLGRTGIAAASVRMALVAGLVAAALSVAAPARAIEIKPVTSPKGITAWLITDRSVPLVSLQFAFRGGSALDPKGKEGLAEMASGLLDEGAGPYASARFQKELEENSITLRFNASLDSFGGSLRALNENRDQAVDLLRLALTQPRFDPEPLARVKGQMLAQVEREAERARNVADQVWHRTAFGDHPYARDVDGTRRTIPTITADDLRGFVKRRFGRDNLVIGVVGDISEGELVKLLDRAFGDLPEKAAPWTLPQARVAGAGKVVVVNRQIPQTVVQFGQAGIGITDPDFYAATVMNYIMGGGGLTSRLADEVREKRGLAYSIYTQLVTYDHGGVLMGWVATRNTRIKETLDLVRAEWTRMGREPVFREELDDARAYLTGSYFTRLNSTARIAGLLVGIQLDNLGIDYLTRRNKLIEAVTAADIQRVARRLLKPEALTVVLVGKPEGITATP